jgi:hypothetical protein
LDYGPSARTSVNPLLPANYKQIFDHCRLPGSVQHITKHTLQLHLPEVIQHIITKK